MPAVEFSLLRVRGVNLGQAPACPRLTKDVHSPRRQELSPRISRIVLLCLELEFGLPPSNGNSYSITSIMALKTNRVIKNVHIRLNYKSPYLNFLHS